MDLNTLQGDWGWQISDIGLNNKKTNSKIKSTEIHKMCFNAAAALDKAKNYPIN